MRTISRLTWGKPRNYEVGVDRGVYYPQIGPGEAWSGLVSVIEAPSDTDENVRYVDGVKIHQRRKLGFFSGAIESYSYPDSLYEDIFTQRRAKTFGLSYRTGTAKSYKIHLVYNVIIGPSPYIYQQSETELFRWPFSTQPITVFGETRTAHLVVDPTVAYPAAVVDLEDLLYGTDTTDPMLPSPQEVLDIFEEHAILKVTDNGDGSFTVEGPDSAITMLDATTFEITWPSAIYIDAESYTLSSL